LPDAIAQEVSEVNFTFFDDASRGLTRGLIAFSADLNVISNVRVTFVDLIPVRVRATLVSHFEPLNDISIHCKTI
jgi:hypothetical protein